MAKVGAACSDNGSSPALPLARALCTTRPVTEMPRGHTGCKTDCQAAITDLLPDLLIVQPDVTVRRTCL